MAFDLSRMKRSSGSGVTGREIGFSHLMPLPPQSIPYKSIITWPFELKVGNVEGKSESTDTHRSKEAAEGVCSLAMKEGFGGEGKYFPIATRVEPIFS